MNLFHNARRQEILHSLISSNKCNLFWGWRETSTNHFWDSLLFLGEILQQSWASVTSKPGIELSFVLRGCHLCHCSVDCRMLLSSPAACLWGAEDQAGSEIHLTGDLPTDFRLYLSVPSSREGHCMPARLGLCHPVVDSLSFPQPKKAKILSPNVWKHDLFFWIYMRKGDDNPSSYFSLLIMQC